MELGSALSSGPRKIMQLILRVVGILGVIVTIIWWIAKPGFDPLYAFLSALLALLISFISQSNKSTIESLDKRNRQVMLDHMENFWVKGILEKSLYGAALLELGIKEDLTAINYPWTIKKESTNEILATGKTMLEIFQQIGMGRSLLILGTPGSGKTTMLLKLTRELIQRARQDDTEPIPIVLNLASWKEKQTLADWISSQLNLLYYVPKQTAPTWIIQNRMFLLLDGLDEVEQQIRFKCIHAINQFRKIHGLTSVVVCCRVEDYSLVDTKLSLEGAIVLLPLTSEKIDDYFNHLGEGLSNIKELLRKDHALQELATTPLMLSIMTLAYKDRKVDDLNIDRSSETQRKHIFDMYIERMFERPTRTINITFSKLETLRYLRWLSHEMLQQNMTAFQIETLQPSWLAEVSYRNLYRILVGLFIGLLAGLIGSLIFGLIVGFAVGMLVGMIFGFLTKSFFEEIIIFLNRVIETFSHFPLDESWRWARPGENVYFESEDAISDVREMLPISWTSFLNDLGNEIAIVDKLTWSWKKAIGGLGMGLIIGLGGALIIKAQTTRLSELISSIGFGLLGALLSGLSVEQIDETTQPGQHLRQTFINSIVAFLTSGIIITLISRLFAGPKGLGPGLFVGLLAGLSLGGKSLIQHYLLRIVLSQKGLLPLKLTSFLDHAVDLIFLRRVGGSYIFIHRLLMEHFAEMKL
jgi:large-conductance mechanosensitive channel